MPDGPSPAELRQERLKKAREKQEALKKQMAEELPPPEAAPPKPKPAPAPAAPRKPARTLSSVRAEGRRPAEFASARAEGRRFAPTRVEGF